MNGGAISGNEAVTASGFTGGGGGVFVLSGNFTMTGGVISGNSVTGIDSRGGGVALNSGTFTMSGGTIGVPTGGISADANTAESGGGIVINGGIFTMSGGTISENTATNKGGGVYTDGDFTLSGGTISSNTAVHGGGVYVAPYTTFTMEGGTIKENEATGSGWNGSGGGLWIDIANGASTMSGGTISGNIASDTGSQGGGIYKRGSGNFNLIGGTIGGSTPTTDGNKAQYGGGIYIEESRFTMSNADPSMPTIISGNTAVESGGGVYLGTMTPTFTMKGGTITDDNTAATGNTLSLYDEEGAAVYAAPLAAVDILASGYTATDAALPYKVDGVATPWPPTYVIGETGPAGGIIFYIASAEEIAANGWTCLEAAPADIPGYVAWATGNSPYPVIHWTNGTSGTALGTGKINTKDILNGDPTAPAARACVDYRSPGHPDITDWFLPSKDELYRMYTNLYQADPPLGAFDVSYWSSSENDSDFASTQFFDDNDLVTSGEKFNTESVRAIRAF
jgi:predicted outer membrane repeat protein